MLTNFTYKPFKFIMQTSKFEHDASMTNFQEFGIQLTLIGLASSPITFPSISSQALAAEDAFANFT